jgi:hypothetical protein
MGVLLSVPALAITIDDVRAAEHAIEIRKTLEAAGFKLKA